MRGVIIFVHVFVSLLWLVRCPPPKEMFWLRHCVRSGDLVYATVVETEEDLVARITVAAGTSADMPGIFERTRQ